MTNVTAMLRRNAVRSPRRMAHTANWHVNDDRISSTVAGPTSGRISRWNGSAGLGVDGRPHGRVGADVEVGREEAGEEHHLGGDEQQHPEDDVADAAALVVGVARRPGCARWSSGRGRRWPSAVARRCRLRQGRVVRCGRSVADVEHRPLGPDLGQVVEVVRRRRRAGRPLEGVALPRVVARRLAAAQRHEDVPEQRDHARGDEEPADRSPRG